jgi:4-aminobutyrate aminotransferase
MAALRPLVRRHERIVREVRGRGLMIGVRFDSGETAEAVQWAAFQRGLLVLEAGIDTIRLCPPLVVDEAEVATAVRLFSAAIAEVEATPRSVVASGESANAINEVEASG